MEELKKQNGVIELSSVECSEVEGGIIGVLIGGAIAVQIFLWGVCYDMGKSYR